MGFAWRAPVRSWGEVVEKAVASPGAGGRHLDGFKIWSIRGFPFKRCFAWAVLSAARVIGAGCPRNYFGVDLGAGLFRWGEVIFVGCCAFEAQRLPSFWSWRRWSTRGRIILGDFFGTEFMIIGCLTFKFVGAWLIFRLVVAIEARRSLICRRDRFLGVFLFILSLSFEFEETGTILRTISPTIGAWRTRSGILIYLVGYIADSIAGLHILRVVLSLFSSWTV